MMTPYQLVLVIPLHFQFIRSSLLFRFFPFSLSANDFCEMLGAKSLNLQVDLTTCVYFPAVLSGSFRRRSEESLGLLPLPKFMAL